MADNELDPKVFGITEYDEARLRIIAETAEMRQTAVSISAERHLPEIDRIETLALEAIEKEDKEIDNG